MTNSEVTEGDVSMAPMQVDSELLSDYAVIAQIPLGTLGEVILTSALSQETSTDVLRDRVYFFATKYGEIRFIVIRKKDCRELHRRICGVKEGKAGFVFEVVCKLRRPILRL